MLNRLCVLIPAKDEELVIAQTIQSVLQADILPSDIYVIDDGSSDETSAIARRFGVETLRNEKNVGKARAIKRGIEHFELSRRYTHLALMDADTRVSTGYFKEVCKAFAKDEKIVVVCGQAKSSPYNWLTAYRCLAYFLSHFIYKGGQANMGVITVAPGCSTTYRTTILHEIDWSPDTIVEDMDVTVQVHHKRLGKIAYCNEAVVFTQDPRTLRDYIKQLFRWHTGAWQVGMKYHMLTGLKKLDWEYKLLMGEGILFATMFMLLPLWLVLSPKRTLLALALDLVVTMAISAYVSITDKRKDVVTHAPIFLTLRYLDCAVFLYCFWNTVIRQQKVSGWFAVKRYQQQ
jgi:cellulose synthase/poly-beta-1,6-N-acetylglucosamine synthase-like glycosyltransferase